MFQAIIGVIGTLLAVCIYCLGYAVANTDIATECEKLGAFYVNKAVYACERVSAKSERSK